MPDSPIGTIFGERYEIRELLGSGGWANVSLNLPVAVKVRHAHLTGTGQYAKRFEQEAKNVSKIDSPNVQSFIKPSK